MLTDAVGKIKLPFNPDEEDCEWIKSGSAAEFREMSLGEVTVTTVLVGSWILYIEFQG